MSRGKPAGPTAGSRRWMLGTLGAALVGARVAPAAQVAQALREAKTPTLVPLIRRLELDVRRTALNPRVTLICVTDRSAPGLAAALLHDHGARHAAPGVAEVGAQLALHGASAGSDDDDVALTARRGGSLGATTAPGWSRFDVRLPSSELAFLAWLSAARLGAGGASEAGIAAARARAGAGRARALAAAFAFERERLLTSAFGAALVTPDDVARADDGSVLRFVEGYATERAVIAVVGDAELDDVVAQLGEALAAAGVSDRAVEDKQQPASTASTSTPTTDRPPDAGAREPCALFGWRIAGALEPACAPYHLLAELLAGGTASAAARQLARARLDPGGASAGIEDGGASTALFGVQLSFDEATLKRALALGLPRATLSHLAHDLSAVDLERARRRHALRTERALGDSLGLARALASAELVHGEARRLALGLSAIEAAARGDVQKAAAALAARAADVNVGDRPQEPSR